MNAQLQALIETGKKRWTEERASGRPRINVCVDTSSLARGAEETVERLREVAEKANTKVDIGITGSWGFCWLEPTVTVRTAAGTRTVLYGEITPDRVEEFFQKVVLEGQDIPEWALGVVEGNPTPEIPLLSEHPFMVGQVRRLMERSGTIDPGNIDHYLAHGGYEGFGKALEMSDEDIIKEMLDSGLGGRGGGGFPAGRKWDFLRNATAEPRYLVCNADEGDPGAWVNRILMEGDPHLIIEGMMIAALAAHAVEAYVYIRYEYPLAVERMQAAVNQARESGLLGKDILGTGFDFDVIVFKGAGSYVCGEETGLINSIDGYRGMPRIKPPFPAQAGLWNKPTNVNNVETYANAPLIMRNGALWWSGVSEAKDKGTKMFTFSGAINQPGCIEIPFGPTVRDLMETYAGGLKEGSELKGFQPGGPLSGVLHAREADLPLTLDPYRERGMFLGSGGIIFFDQHTSIVDLCLWMVSFCEFESCGRCTTCQGGSARAVELLRKIDNGTARESDLDRLRDLVQTLVWSNCLHGQFTMTSVKLALNYFEDEFRYVINERRDPAGSLPGLHRYVVRSQTDEQLADAIDICPADAFVNERGSWAIDDELCVKCGACKEVAPNAIDVVERYHVQEKVEAAVAG
jgi:NADH-quinone oxidoreductase subunit F